DHLTQHGYHYGPTFQALTAAWKSGDTLFAEIRLPAEALDGASRYDIHPALLDAALHPLLLETIEAGGEPGAGSPRVPFALSGVQSYGAGATSLRARITKTGDDSFSVDLADPAGLPVLSIAELTTRPLNGTGAAPAPYVITWTEVPAPAPADDRVEVDAAELGTAGGRARLARRVPRTVLARLTEPALKDGLAAAHQVTEDVLRLLQDWLADEQLSAAKLVLVTSGAIATTDAEDIPALALSPVWGLVRSAQSEHPGRFQLIDTDWTDAGLADEDTAAQELLARAAAADEPQLAVRAGRLLAPRLARASDVPYSPASPIPSLDRGGTVLITGGTGALAGHIARHLV
ncbi:polyketide synthase dehydratase domain-containing protein, partial [Frankia sp. AgB1.9]|uniref:polyketide synthase dehydratase domain-containing protein n=1 Tax=unclassified Frankia TaxID=2632575 RepID=UPI0019343267